MYDVEIERLKDNMISFVLRQMKTYVRQENYELQQRYENIVMLCRQCFMYQDRSMMENLKSMIYELNDDLREGDGIREHRRYEYIIRENSRISEEMLLVALSRKYDTSTIDVNLDAELIVLFRQIWLSGKTTPAVITALNDFISRSDSFMLTFIVYAMMLRCVRYYDRALVRLLMEMRTPESFVALSVVMMCHAGRIANDNSQHEAFAAFIADPLCCSRMVQALNLLLRTNETLVIAREFEKNIYPEVMKKRTDLNINEIIDKGKNPDWEALLEGSPLMEKMRRINDMQLKGKDVNFATFRAMKGYPFFSDTAHWFFPFTLNYRELNSVKGMDEKGVELLARVANICDSDRYSLFLMFGAMGIHNMEAALGNMGVSKMNDLQDMVDDSLKKADEVQFGLRLRYSVMNIFRFYNLAPNHSDFVSPFDVKIQPNSIVELRDLFDTETVATLANAAFSAKAYETALNIYRSCVDQIIDSDIHLFQKMGYCHEQMGQYGSAIDYYNQSDVLLPDDVWTLRRLAHCCRQEHEADLATCVRIQRRLIAAVPDDIAAVRAFVDWLMKYEFYDEAVPLLYRLEYATPCYEVWNMLAHSLMMTDKKEDAAKYYAKACKATEAEPETFVYAAINDMLCGGQGYEPLLREAYGILNDTKAFMQLFYIGYADEMMMNFTEEQRDIFTNTINKIIIES